MDSFSALEDTLLQALLDACAVPLSADEESSLDAMLSSSQSSWSSDGATSSTVPSDAERHGSGNMTLHPAVGNNTTTHTRVPLGLNALPSPATTGFDTLPSSPTASERPTYLQGPHTSSAPTNVNVPHH
ncbi:hypothetical protein EV714DRAFT_272921 [Schizophyllum commune]